MIFIQYAVYYFAYCISFFYLDPVDKVVSLEPCILPFCVMPGVLHYELLGIKEIIFTVQETAETAGVSVATAKRQIRKANQLLRKKLEGWYYDE